jgi:hypothetical protein
MARYLLNGAEKSSDIGGGNFADVDLRYHRHNCAAKASNESCDKPEWKNGTVSQRFVDKADVTHIVSTDLAKTVEEKRLKVKFSSCLESLTSQNPRKRERKRH